LAAIGIILILKQIPHVFGHDADPEGEMSFVQPDDRNTFSELFALFGDLHTGAAVIGIASVLLLIFWDKIKPLKNSLIPAPLVVVLFGVGMSLLFKGMGPGWLIQTSHLVQVPVADNIEAFLGFLQFPDFSLW